MIWVVWTRRELGMVVLMVRTRKVDLRSVKKRETRIGIELITGVMIQLKE